MHIVAGHDRNTFQAGQIDGLVQIRLFSRSTGTLQFQIKAVRKDSLPVIQSFSGKGVLVCQQCLADIASATAGECNQPCGMPFEPVPFQHRDAALLPFCIGT